MENNASDLFNELQHEQERDLEAMIKSVLDTTLLEKLFLGTLREMNRK